MKKDYQKGFTLIELLVVVAVISLLVAVVVASLNSSRTKASDKAAQSDLNNIRTQANLYYVNNGNSYGTITAACNAGMYSADTTIAAALTHATANSTLIQCSTGPTNQTFAVAIRLKATTGYYCVDSTNAGKTNTTATNIYGAGATFALDSGTGLCN